MTLPMPILPLLLLMLSWRLFRAGFGQWFVGKQMPQVMIYEHQFPTFFDRHDQAAFLKRAQILGGGQAFGDSALLNKPNLAIWLLKDQLDEFLAEDWLRQDAFGFLEGLSKQIANGQDLLCCAMGGLLDRLKRVEQPLFPFAALGYR